MEFYGNKYPFAIGCLAEFLKLWTELILEK